MARKKGKIQKSQIHIYLPLDMKATVLKMAEDNCRTISEQVEFIIKNSLTKKALRAGDSQGL